MDRLFKATFLLISVLILVFGITLTVISYMPPDKIKNLIDSFDPDGNYRAFSLKYVVRLRFGGFLTCVAGGFLFMIRKKIPQYISGVIALLLNLFNALKDAAKKEERIHVYAFMTIMLVAIMARIYYLSQPFMGDESRVFDSRIYHAHGIKGLINVVSTHSQAGDHMFHTLLSYLSYKLFGSEQSMWALRLPAFFAGILLIPATYLTVRMFYNKHAALLASGIVAASSPLISYSANARGYTMLCLIFMLILALGAYIKNNNDPAGWHLFAILSALGFYTIPIMLYPYGILITWLALSFLFKDTDNNRSRFLQNMLGSVAITVLFTFLLYSPVILIGTGPNSFTISKDIFEHNTLAQLPGYLGHVISDVFWLSWNNNLPVVIIYLLIAGFICSIFSHKKISTHRVPVVLAILLSVITITFLNRIVCHYYRCWIFLLPIYIGIASSGLIYLCKPLELFFSKYKTAVLTVLSLTLSLVLMGNQIRSEPHQIGDLSDSLQSYKANFDESGEYVEFKYIFTSLRVHIGGRSTTIVVMLPSPSKDEFWKSRLKYYFRDLADVYLIYDINSYVSKDSQGCHNLILLSNESSPTLEYLLEKNGVHLSNYTTPQLVHSFKHANMYSMSRIKNCDPANLSHK
jgi:uncharacterized membrane protein